MWYRKAGHHDRFVNDKFEAMPLCVDLDSIYNALKYRLTRTDHLPSGNALVGHRLRLHPDSVKQESER